MWAGGCRLALILGFSIAASLQAVGSKAEELGRYLDPLNVEMIEGRLIRLLNDFRYEDPNRNVWTAKKDYKSDGASIPQFFWALVGGPLDGPYRMAAVIHDYYCFTKEKDWRSTHLVFYQAMRAAGVSEIDAQIKYFAVLVGGPRWSRIAVDMQTFNSTVCLQTNGSTACTRRSPDSSALVLATQPVVGTSDRDAVEAFKRRLEAGERFSLQDIERLASQRSERQFPALMQ